MNKKETDFTIEMTALGEADAKTTARVKRALGERAYASAVKAVQASNKAILTQYPENTELAAMHARAEKTETKRRFTLPRFVPAIAAAAVLVIALIPVGTVMLSHRNPSSMTVDGLRVKGEPKIFIIQKRGENGVELANNARVKPGDLVQLRYMAGGAKYGVIFSIDGAGSVTLHYPYTRRESTELTQGKAVSLRESYELDSAPRHETFIFVTHSDAIDVAAVLKTARTLGPGKLTAQAAESFPGMHVQSFTLIKE
ncbi:MAG: hypothetical protein HZC28_13815 [Spirochaetes bacterium]|nr:hypothetical protein [Spirochaetota bacterium]